MLVNFGARLESGNFVVRPAKRKRGPMGDVLAEIPALRVEYRNHFWNSESAEAKEMYARYAEAMTDLGQPTTPEDAQKLVEGFIENHPWRNHVDGYRVYILDERGEVVTPSALPAMCMTIKIDEETGDSNVCGKEVLEGEKHCAECLEEMTAVNA